MLEYEHKLLVKLRYTRKLGLVFGVVAGILYGKYICIYIYVFNILLYLLSKKPSLLNKFLLFLLECTVKQL